MSTASAAPTNKKQKLDDDKAVATTTTTRMEVDEDTQAPPAAPLLKKDDEPDPDFTSIFAESDTAFSVVLDFLDAKSVGRLSIVNRSFRQTLDSKNLYWFSCACEILKKNYKDDNDDKDMPTCGAAARSNVDWKKVVTFHSDRNQPAMSFKDPLMDYVLMLGARNTETKVQCTGTTPLEPRFYVPSAGMQLSLPLEPRKLRALINGGYCEQAPVGRGPDTIVDTDTRNCWRLMLGKDVIIGDKDWNMELTCAGFDVDGILHEIEESLMPHLFGQGDVWAQPYSMLIYEEGSFFKPHRDTLRGPNHFGSLSIVLPVHGDCKGGEFRLTHNSASDVERKVVAEYVPPKAGDECSYVAFFTDVYHEVLPVTSGFRVSLTYHLWAVPNSSSSLPSRLPPPPVPMRNVEKSDDESVNAMLMAIFEKVIKDHTEDCECRYAFALDHSYSSLTLHPMSLRGRDKIFYDMFYELNDVTVDLERIPVQTYHKPDDVTDYKELELVLCDSDGYERDAEGPSSRTVWLNQERLLFKDHEFSEYSRYTGNEGYEKALQYEHACIILQRDGFELEN